MQRYPPDISRKPDRPARNLTPAHETEQHCDQDERDATAAWLAHLAAGRITVE